MFGRAICDKLSNCVFQFCNCVSKTRVISKCSKITKVIYSQNPPNQICGYLLITLITLTSNHIFGSGDFWDKSPSWFLKILKLAWFYSGNFKIFKNTVGQFITNRPPKSHQTNKHFGLKLISFNSGQLRNNGQLQNNSVNGAMLISMNPMIMGIISLFVA